MLKAITVGIFYSSSSVSIPLPSALPLDHLNLSKRETLYCKQSTELGVRSPGSWLGAWVRHIGPPGLDFLQSLFVRSLRCRRCCPLLGKSSDLGPMTLLGTVPLLHIQLLFSQFGSFCWLFDVRSFLLKHNILHCLTLFQ